MTRGTQRVPLVFGMTPKIFKNLKTIVTQISETCKQVLPKTPGTGRPRKLGWIDALTFALYQHTSTRATKKSAWSDFKQSLGCAYSTFVTAVNEAAVIALRILFIVMRMNRAQQHLVKFTDATDIPVCLKRNGKHHRTMRGLAAWGNSGKGFYFGLKMTMTRDDDGKILSLVFSPSNTDDRKLFRKANKDIKGIIVADAGYCSKEWERDMYEEGKRWCLIKPYKNMKRLATAWQLALYKRRYKIEFDFRSLKMFHGLLTSLPRSINGYIGNYILALLSFVLADRVVRGEDFPYRLPCFFRFRLRGIKILLAYQPRIGKK